MYYVTEDNFTYDKLCLIAYILNRMSHNNMVWHILRATREHHCEINWWECEKFLEKKEIEFRRENAQYSIFNS